MAITRGGGNGGRGGGRDKVKPKRGGPRHFTVHPRDLYMKEGRPEGCPSDEEESDSQASQVFNTPFYRLVYLNIL